MKCTNRVRVYPPGYESDGLEVACGKCTNCRVAKRREWTLRIAHEMEFHDCSLFVTLTYRKEQYPENDSLSKEHLIGFLKRLRRRIEPRKIRVFAVGEYGDEEKHEGKITHPHYHLIIFGMNKNDEDEKVIMDCWPFTEWSVKTLRKRGIQFAEPWNIKYITKYLHKKYTGDLEDETYTSKGLVTPFRILSRGIGFDYCDKYSDKLRNNKRCTLYGISYSIPRAYVKRLGLSPEELSDYGVEKEKIFVESLTNEKITRDEAYKKLTVGELLAIEQTVKNNNAQHEKNILARMKMKNKKL